MHRIPDNELYELSKEESEIGNLKKQVEYLRRYAFRLRQNDYFKFNEDALSENDKKILEKRRKEVESFEALADAIEKHMNH